MGRRVSRRAGRWRDLLTTLWDHRMQHWRIEGHVYPFEEALKAGGDVVVSSGRLAAALEHAGQRADRFDDGGPDAASRGCWAPTTR
jgi:hypothetical protein